jgi:hypothetical protein
VKRLSVFGGHGVDFRVREWKGQGVSAAEIIQELPRLTEAERRAVRQKLLELAAKDEQVQLCEQTALEGARLLDRMEDKDVRRQPR